ncbi:protein transporter Sec31 [Streptomyces huasconensis]|uniref:protein transporter Sec31 n=1 Tax=Streptomyces huasconensis TaxID=1854574 RepID=UPI0036F65874
MKTRPTTQYVPHTLDGKTRMIPVEVDTSTPPRDWDHLVLNGVTGIAALVLTASVVWSTASIGDLLARVVIKPAAYGGAVVFDLVWIACMAIEWLSRYDAERAALPRRAGHAALGVAMAAVAAHGYIADQLVIGVVGAVVSGLAKGLWTVVLAHQTPALDPRTREFLRQELAEAGATMAVIPARRRVQRMQHLAAAERKALADSGSANPDRPDEDTDEPDDNVLPINPGALTTKDAVRIAWDSGLQDRDAVARYVGKATGKMPSPETVDRYLRALRVGA